MTKNLPLSKNAAVQASGARPTLSLGNQDSNMGPNLQTLDDLSPPTKGVNGIPAFIIWSVFNLLFIPFGILCCYFSYKVNQFKNQNRYEVAIKWSKRTFVINVITTLLMFGVIITVVMLHYDNQQRNHANQGNQTQVTVGYIPWQPGR